MSLWSYLASFRCKHEFKFVRNIYGDEIIYCGYMRSEVRCVKCGKTKFMPALQPEAK